MPRVPTYDSFQVAPNVQPSAQFDAPRVVDSTSKLATELGTGMLNLGVAGARIEQDAINQANQVRVNDAVNQAIQAKLRLTYDRQAGFVNLRGDAALNRPNGKALPEEYGEMFGAEIQRISQSLGNEDQRRIFGVRAADLNTQFQGLLVQHVAKENFDYAISVQDGTVKTAIIEGASMWGDPAVLSQSRDRIRAAAAEKGRLSGTSPVQVEANTVMALSDLNASVVQNAVDARKLDYAHEYFKQHEKEFTPDARLHATKLLDAGAFEERTQGFTEAVMTEAGGDTTQALVLARQRYSGKEEDAVVTRIKALDAERVVMRERGQKDAADTAWQMYASGKRPPISLLQSMDGRDRTTLEEKMKADAEGRAIKTNVAKWLEFTDMPLERMARLSGTQILTNYRMVFSDADLRNAQQMVSAARAALNKQPGEAEGLQLITTTDLVKRSAREIGILPSKGSPTATQEGQFLDFTDQVQLRVNDWEVANKKKATPEVVRGILNDMKLDKVKVDVWGSDPEKPISALSADDLSKAYVVVNFNNQAQEVRLAAIPPSYRTNAIARRRAAGLPVSESAIAQMWVADGRPAK